VRRIPAWLAALLARRDDALDVFPEDVYADLVDADAAEAATVRRVS